MIRTIALLLAMLSATAAQANALTDADLQRVFDLDQKTVAFAKDLGAVGPQGTCGLELMDATNDLLNLIGPIRDLVELDFEMTDRADKQAVLNILRIDLQTAPQSFALGRRTINSAMGGCAANTIVAVKGQELLHLFDEAGALFASFSAKLRR